MSKWEISFIGEKKKRDNESEGMCVTIVKM